MNIKFIVILILFIPAWLGAQVGQISFARVEQMPNEPSPYNIRDWKVVAQKYDSFVYDESKTGQYLPLVFTNSEGVNYPERPNFGLHTYVGTVNPNNGEGINVLPSLVSASLVGIDKTDQFGRNWVLMSQDFFNKQNNQNLYLNNIGGKSGSDWWYDMMPNIFFYQLYDQYGAIGDAEYQFNKVAEVMANSVRTLGGSDTPWKRAFMEYRAFDFLNGVPNPDGVNEPEAAGAYAWLLYHAHNQTDNPEYLKAAEWSMEFLVNRGANPSYELQLPYGAYTAAKMNAEIGTTYDTEKLLFWVFNRGPLRGWGNIVGTWNGFDVSGLVGEANDGGNDYAFQLNGVQQAAAIVPLVRYEKQFARSIGKWFLNMANATRLMFPGFLPNHLQDASDWSNANDPDQVIGYEALREVWMGNEPFATGDALRGGWAGTNLSLYSTSSIGYLGAIMDMTNVEKILKLDLLATDFFHDEAYPSYLYYNPYNVLKSVEVELGNEPVDVYDVLSENFLVQGAMGTISIDIPSDEALSIVLCPAGGSISYMNNLMMVDGVIVDYGQTQSAYNYPPRIQAFAPEQNPIETGDTLTLYAKGIDQETKDLIYTFILPEDTISGEEEEMSWIVPEVTGFYEFGLIATDEASQSDTLFITVEVTDEVNIPPVISFLQADPNFTEENGTVEIAALVEDENNDQIEYIWNSDQGTIAGSRNQIEWTAPSTEGIYNISLTVNDGRGGQDQKTVQILVYSFDQIPQANLIAYYPFSGNALDQSGNQLDGQVSGAKLTEDLNGQSGMAYFFDGVNDHITVANEAILNFKDGITVSFYAKPETIGDKERFFISHGSWQNRWKISVIPDGKVRWTLKNENNQIRDLDSQQPLEEDVFYHVAATYDGKYLLLYIDGELVSFTTLSGKINESPTALEIAQMLPTDNGFNSRAVLDEIRIYDFALPPDSIKVLAGDLISGIDLPILSKDCYRIYPNPTNGNLKLEFIPEGSCFQSLENSEIRLINSAGQQILTKRINGSKLDLDLTALNPGYYFLEILSGGALSVEKIILTQ